MATPQGIRAAAPPGAGAASGDVPRLRRGVLGLADIAAATMANIGPAMSFSFGFAAIAAASGVASPLSVLAAAVAIAFLGTTLAEFSRHLPSTGSFVTFIGRSLGPVCGVTAGLTVITGYVIGVGSVVVVSGSISHDLLHDHLGADLPWQVLSVGLSALALALTVAGVRVATRWSGALLGFEVAVLVAVSLTVLAHHAAAISLAPLSPARVRNGLRGLGLGFPLAVYLFVGWENAAALAEETSRPRRDVPRALLLSISAMTVTYLLLAYACVVGFDADPRRLAGADLPLLDLARGSSPVVAVLAELAVLTSTLGVLIAASNSQARLLFNAAREGLVPRALAGVTGRRRTPHVSLGVFLVLATALVLGAGSRIAPVELFAVTGSLSTTLLILVYLGSHLALPGYVRRHHPERFSVIRHGLLPFLGVVALALPLWGLVQPGQPDPYRLLPGVTLALVMAALAYAVVLRRRDRSIGERIGSILADR